MSGACNKSAYLIGSIFMNASELNELRSIAERKLGRASERKRGVTKLMCRFLRTQGLNGSEIGLVLGISRQAVSIHLRCPHCKGAGQVGSISND